MGGPAAAMTGPIYRRAHVVHLLIAATLLATELACRKAPVAAGGTQRLSLSQLKTKLAAATGSTPPDLSQADLQGLDLSGLDFKRATQTLLGGAQWLTEHYMLVRADESTAWANGPPLRPSPAIDHRDRAS